MSIEAHRKALSATVVIPAYNHENFIGQCIESSATQSYSDVEVIVVDDGSTDRTYDRAVAAAGAFARVRVLSQRNGGVASALNRGVEAATGDVIAILGSDDYMRSDRVAREISALEASRSIGIVHSNASRVDEFGRQLGDMSGQFRPAVGNGADVFEDFAFNRAGVVAPTVMFRRSTWETVGGFDESLPIEDWPFYWRVAARGLGFEYVPEPLTFWRVTPNSMGRSTALHWRAHMEFRRALLFEHLDPETARSAYSSKFSYELRSAILQGSWREAAQIRSELVNQVGWSWEFTRTVVTATAQSILRRIVPRRVYGGVRDSYFRRHPRYGPTADPGDLEASCLPGAR